MNSKSKKFRSQYAIKLNPIMPSRYYNARERAELREFEQKVMSGTDKKNIGKETRKRNIKERIRNGNETF